MLSTINHAYMQRKGIYSGFLLNRKQAFISSVGLSLIINSILIICIVYMSFPLKSFINLNWTEYLQYFTAIFVSNVVLTYILYVINFRIVRKRKSRTKALTIIILSTLVACGLLSPILSQIQWFFLSGIDYNDDFEEYVAFNLLKDIILGVLVLFEIGSRYSNYLREQALIQNQKLIEENISTRYESLKNQLNPHFLFNSLNTLSGLIGIDNDAAHDYVDNLSSIFRYTLHSKAICRLSEEIEFADAYINLLKIRYGGNLVVRYDIDEKYRKWYLMPVSVQLLIENVIKHNTISNKKPLFILIQTTEEDSIVVENIVNPKLESAFSGGVGLSNLADRYSILFKKTIDITHNEGIFKVEIPLIRKINNNIYSL